MLKGKHLAKQLRETIPTTTYMLWFLTNNMRNITLEETWQGTKPIMKHLKVFRSVSYRQVPDLMRRKLNHKANQMKLVEYHSTGAYKLYDLVNNELKEWSQDKTERTNIKKVTFDESTAIEEAQVEENMRRRTRSQVIPPRLQGYKLFLDNEVTFSVLEP